MWPALITLLANLGIRFLEKLKARAEYKASPAGRRDAIHAAIAQAKPGADPAINVLLDDALRDPAARLPDPVEIPPLPPIPPIPPRLPDHPDDPRDPGRQTRNPT